MPEPEPIVSTEVEPAEAAQEIPYSEEVKRKTLHLLALVVPLAMALLGKSWSLILLTPLALLALASDVLRVRSARFASFIYAVFGAMMRPEERPPVGGDVRFNGATWVLVTAVLLALLFPIHIAVAAFAMFMIGDAAAALVGRRWGRLHWFRTRRTVEGSLAFLLAGWGVMALLPGVVFWTGAVATVFGCAAEVLPRPLNDNIRVPLVAGFVLFLLERFALGLDVALF